MKRWRILIVSGFLKEWFMRKAALHTELLRSHTTSPIIRVQSYLIRLARRRAPSFVFRRLAGKKALPIQKETRVDLRLNFIPKKATGIWWATIRPSSLSRIRKNFLTLSIPKKETPIQIAK